ncbi:protein phosphatase 1 regulatory subunit 32 isoform X2 [Aquila chrysaetos chrysaetos]|uniref:protein phosphatase 1 regulatory subunit 32 isoform X2 n=1 Tax=Aquila chrysaetos chrysaetos TaxID=223781 RepID=UPI0011764D83|nr:protein phosphatase 1 regulatory subunit 32 isoform X2 [Aquila chrysaetos chrysaetos]
MASHVSVPALATTPAAATCPTTTRPSPACSARAVQQRATARTPPRPPPLSTSSPFGSLTAGSCCPGMSTSRRAGTSKSPPFPAPTPGGVSPQHTWLLQGPPRASREHGTESRRASPAQPGSVRRLGWGQGQWGSLPAPSAPRRCLAEDDHRCQGAVGLHQGHPEERQHPASPASPARETLPHRVPCPPPAPQPLCTPRDNFALPQLGVSITTTDYLPSVRSHGGETLLALPACSERGNGFSREVPGCLGTAVSRTPSHCPAPCALPVLIHYPHAGLARGGPPHPTRLPRAAGTPSDPGQPSGTAGCRQEGGCRQGLVPIPAGPCTQPTSIPPGAVGVHH